jgi:hypothetical protein
MFQRCLFEPSPKGFDACGPEALYARAFLCRSRRLNELDGGFPWQNASNISDLSENLDNKKGKSQRKTKGTALPPRFYLFTFALCPTSKT